MDLIALTTIHRTKKPGKDATQPGGRKTPPETEEIMAGESFSATAEEFKELEALGAARKADEKAKGKNTKTSAAAAAKQQARKKEEPSGPKAPEDMTIPEIKKELDEAEVDYPSDANKDDLVSILTEHREDGLV